MRDVFLKLFHLIKKHNEYPEGTMYDRKRLAQITNFVLKSLSKALVGVGFWIVCFHYS